MEPTKQRPCAIESNDHAECPFFVKIAAACMDEHQLPQKRKRGRPDKQEYCFQRSPFTPSGKFNSCESLDVLYSIRPRKKWSTMTRYRSFVLHHIKYGSGDFVYVANDRSLSQEDAAKKDSDQMCELHWIAKILEIRALDDTHIYARVYWMYLPDDLPENTLDGQKVVSGRQPYHGQRELMASNHMDIINVNSIVGQATVDQWMEFKEKSEENQAQGVLYWRQALDYLTRQLSVYASHSLTPFSFLCYFNH
ncbi:hypothetical protein TGAM01_v211067 [Trichoderma gamsii]|uniref:BAH domain-containing protein n=1 Tax=Trichoderma gamsii TaxID=398673 RepID=A0A2P4Z701_9HYPO|nr:hypothetical protein TGAM01_v211067 [Trichoderma gamsii]PON20063.1 hypothetical protein TGAM01_v211067 [Trichoderma gamsii]